MRTVHNYLSLFMLTFLKVSFVVSPAVFWITFPAASSIALATYALTVLISFASTEIFDSSSNLSG